MFNVVWLTFYTIAAFASPLTKNQALEAVLGTSDPEELQRMAENPQQYCKERKDLLFKQGRLKTHSEFLHLFTQQTKQRCQDLIKEFGQKKEWFCDLDVFEKILAESKKKDPLLNTAFYYAKLCDHLLYLTKNQGYSHDQFQSEEYFKELLEKAFDRYDYMHCELRHTNLLWSLTKNGLFSMIDYLIVLGENCHLGSTVEDAKARDHFSAHEGTFNSHKGSLQHDIDHALDFYTLFESFQQYGLNVGTYTQECFAEHNTHNILEFGQKVLITFINLHELTPPVVSSMERSLLPKINYFSDPGLAEITPFFMDTSSDIDKIPDQAQDIPSEDMLQALCTWREKYLGKVNNIYLKKAQTAVLQRQKRKLI